MKKTGLRCCIISLLLILASIGTSFSQATTSETVEIQIADVHQTIVGFGASLAYYENWLPIHPNKAAIYDIIFADLSLDILRYRNAYAYDPGMIDRAREFYQAAENSLGYPIKTLSSSWSPDGSLKSNNSHKGAGGTLKYTIVDGQAQFDYAGFAAWWDESLDEYEANGIKLDYISIQNEPGWPADYESCLFDPEEKTTGDEPIAGYNKALDSVYAKVSVRTHKPKILGPEVLGIGYDKVEQYVNKLDETKLDGICHHLYHGVDDTNPFASTTFTKVGNFHPELPHFQTEYYRGDWFGLGGLLYKSLHDENLVAYLYWGLIWGGESNGLVNLENPWTPGSWTDPTKGYIINKKYYSFKQFSGFIHPGWERIESTISGDDGKGVAFVSPDRDSASFVIVNRSTTDNLEMHLSFPGYSIDKSEIYITSDDLNCELSGSLINSAFPVPPHSIVTVAMEISESDPDVLVEQIDLTPGKKTIDVYAESILITADILPANAANKALNWEITSGAGYAQISQLGYLEALGTGDGTVTVRATATDGSGIYTDISIDIINQILISSINLSATKIAIDERLDSTLITAIILPENASSKEVTWEIINGSDIARLESNGWLFALGMGDGDVRVRVSANDASGKLKEIIIKLSNQVSLETIEIVASVSSIDNFQGTMQLNVDYTPDYASNKDVSWSIEEGIFLASIDQSGLLQALGVDNGEVTVKAEAMEDSEIFDLELITLSNQIVGIEHSKTSGFTAWIENDVLHYNITDQSQEFELILYSIEGKQLYMEEFGPHEAIGSILLSKFESNIYFLLKRTTDSQEYVKLFTR